MLLKILQSLTRLQYDKSLAANHESLSHTTCLSPKYLSDCISISRDTVR